MAASYAIQPLTKQSRETVIDEDLIRSCIALDTIKTTDDDRLRVIGNHEASILKEKVKNELNTMELSKVATLVMSYRRIGKIENLFGVSNLTKLCLDNNKIEKIENLDHLTNLQILDLSFNAIRTIEGLDQLTELTDLSLYSNQIAVIGGLNALVRLKSLSLGLNKIENVDDTVTYLHQLRNLKVLVLKGCPVQMVPNYRVRLLAFVPTLRFLDGKSIKESEIASAKDSQRENLLPIDEEDEKRQTEEKEQKQIESTQKDYIRYNCPNEQNFCEELFKLTPDKYTLYELLRCDALISASKEPLDRFQMEFNEKLTELAERMKAIRLKRDSDDEKYATAKATYTRGNVDESLHLIKQFEQELYKYVPKEISSGAGVNIGSEVKAALLKRADELQSNLMELEANQMEVFSSLQSVTVNKWKSDGVDVLIQSSFESFLKAESDFQVAVRQIFDTYYEQRKKKNVDGDSYYTSKQEESIRVLLESREDYQKFLGDVFEMRRKRLEDAELFHLAAEEKLLTERSRAMSEEERTRHRSRIIEIDTYIQSIKKRLN